MVPDHVLARCRERMQDWVIESKAPSNDYSRGEALGYVHGMLYVLLVFDQEARDTLQQEWDDLFVATNEGFV